MSLDFNTLEPQKQNRTPSLNQHGSFISRKQAFLLTLALFFSVLAVAGVLYTLSNMPKPEPVSIQCSPDLLKKIESQAKILEEISKKSKPGN